MAIARRQAQGIMSMEVINDNLKLMLKTLGDRCIEAIQKSGAYSKEEVVRLVIDGKETQFDMQKLQSIDRALRDVSVGRYECYVDTQPSTPTQRLANYYALVDGMKAGIPIPPHLIVRASDLPYKDEIEQGIKQQMEMAQQKEQMLLKEKDKDRQLEMAKIGIKTKGDIEHTKEKQKGEMLRDTQEHMFQEMHEGKEKNNGKNRESD